MYKRQAYRRIKDDSCAAHVKVNVDKAGNLMRVSQAHLDSGSFAPTSVLAGEFTIFAKTGPAPIYSSATVIEHTDFVGRYGPVSYTHLPEGARNSYLSGITEDRQAVAG